MARPFKHASNERAPPIDYEVIPVTVAALFYRRGYFRLNPQSSVRLKRDHLTAPL